MDDFKIEHRYIVIKLKDLSHEQSDALDAFLTTSGVRMRGGVVIESDWPEYPHVVNMIRNRVKNGMMVTSISYLHQVPQSDAPKEAVYIERGWQFSEAQRPLVCEGKLCPKCLKTNIKCVGATPDGINMNLAFNCNLCGEKWEGN